MSGLKKLWNKIKHRVSRDPSSSRKGSIIKRGTFQLRNSKKRGRYLIRHGRKDYHRYELVVMMPWETRWSRIGIYNNMKSVRVDMRNILGVRG